MSKDKEKKTQTSEEEVEVTEEAKEEQTNEDVLLAELQAAKDQYLRLAAEYDNYRKRSMKEKDEAFINAKIAILSEMLPVLDNFDRACAAEDTSLEDFKKGVDMTHTQFTDTLSKLGVESFGETKDAFDPNFHNAVMHVDDETFGENEIAEVFQKGYKTGDKVLRPAMVKVAN